MRKNQIQWFTLITVMSLMVVAAGCGSSSKASIDSQASADQQANVTKVRIGLDTAGNGSPQYRVAKEEGFFKKYGIEAETSDFAYGIDTINAMLVGRTDAGIAADYAMLNSLGKGNMSIVATISRSTPESAKRSFLLVNDSIQTEQDIKGKRLGVPRATVGEYVWFKYLEKLGINDKDVTFVNYTSPDEAIVAARKGDIDAIWASGDLLAKLEKIETLRKLVDGTANNHFVRAYFLVQTEYVKDNPDVVGRILQALDESTSYTVEHPDVTADILYKSIKIPKESTLRNMEATGLVLGFSQEDYDHLKKMYDWLIDRGILDSSLYKLEEKINIDPLKKVLPDAVSYQP
ncbi:ABC transporter substrate-binding protein [Paenibacillus sp. 1001270B_150601_E10]|uniref:ABC transporter substrate-binding protein n=1 Tax=Paenibacillus sp. 1001270B_150601_E10 TaxID=2787079 RepID=UPI0018A06E45|nr:ABC transporter substrate-binding protein [Paenibacillus sp. 1001270B_150601_E10]